MKNEVGLRLGNLQSSDPFYSYLGNWINRASNEVIMRALSKRRKKTNLFPELFDKWTEVTVVDQSWLGVPSDCLFVHDLFSYDTATLPDEDDDPVQPMQEITWRQYQLLGRDAADAGAYPRLWVRYGARIYFHEVPRSGKTTYVSLLGFAREAALSADADTLKMDAIWHPAVVDYAVYLGAEAMGDDQEADRSIAKCDRQLEQTTGVLGMENQSDRFVVAIKGDPTGRGLAGVGY